jgi:hypothetical protein
LRRNELFDAKSQDWSRTRLWVTLFVVFEARKTSMARLGLKAHHEMGPMGLGVRFSFALERDDVRARLCDRLGILGPDIDV